jgi:Ca2+-dependent lipid-binding protein
VQYYSSGEVKLINRNINNMPKSTVHIHVSCNKLKNKDVTSKSDPCCVLYRKEGDGDDDDGWKEVGRTETIQNCLDPQFTRHFEVEYDFDETQKVKFEVYDIDNKSEKLTDDDFLGQIETTLAEVVSENPLTKPLKLKGKGKDKLAGGTITLRVQDAAGHGQHHHDTLKMLFKGQKLDNKDTAGKSDPFLEFSRKTDDGHWQVVFKTEVVNNNLNPTWRPIHIKASQLCHGDYSSPLKIECKDYDSNGKHDLIGSFTTSVAELIRNPKGHQWHCVNEAMAKKKKYEHSGTIIMEFCEVEKD